MRVYPPLHAFQYLVPSGHADENPPKASQARRMAISTDVEILWKLNLWLPRPANLEAVSPSHAKHPGLTTLQTGSQKIPTNKNSDLLASPCNR
jgi:hypothetical protein